MAGVNHDNLDEVFTYHEPENDAQIESYNRIREDGRRLALTILNETPLCADQQAAIRKIREAVMEANAAVALKGLV